MCDLNSRCVMIQRLFFATSMPASQHYHTLISYYGPFPPSSTPLVCDGYYLWFYGSNHGLTQTINMGVEVEEGRGGRSSSLLSWRFAALSSSLWSPIVPWYHHHHHYHHLVVSDASLPCLFF